MRSRTSRALIWGVLAAVSVVATSCLQSDVDVTVGADGSGEVVVEVFPNSDVLAALASLDLESALRDAWTGSGDAEVEKIEGANGRDGYRIAVPFDDVSTLAADLTNGVSFAGQDVTLFRSFSLEELADSGWSLDATVNPLGQTIAANRPGGVPGSADELLDAAGVGSAGTGLDLTISLPGTVQSSNADTTDGGSATWRLDEPDAPARLMMQTEPKEFPTTAQLVIGAAVLAVVVGLVLLVVGAARPYRPTEGDRRRRRARRATQQPDPTSAWAPTPAVQSAVTRSDPPSSDRPDPLPSLQGFEGSVPALPVMPVADAPTVPETTETPAAPEAPEAPQPTEASGPVPGWYEDPAGEAALRWWDGAQWTDRTG